MTVEKKSDHVKYLDTAAIRIIYGVLEQGFKEIGEMLPSYSLVPQEGIETLVILPQTTFYDIEQYPTLASKAAILLYKINKGHVFPNGNKRMSIACMLVFLRINGKDLDVSNDEITKKALWLAQSDANDFEAVKRDLEAWITSCMVDLIP